MKITLLAHHIEWDTDGDMDAARGLPSKVEVEVDLDAVECLFPVSINDQICNQLSDITGFCVLDYKLQGYSAEADFALQMTNAQTDSNESKLHEGFITDEDEEPYIGMPWFGDTRADK